MINPFEDRPHAAEIESEPKFRAEIITAPDELIDLETQRVMFYLGKYEEYQQKGYGDILRFPEGIDSAKSSEINIDDVRRAIKTEFDINKELYDRFAGFLSEANEQVQTCVPVAERLYGFDVIGNYQVAPTAYGMVGGTSPAPCIYFRLPELTPSNLGDLFTTGKHRSLVEMLVHEILAHEATSQVREGTSLVESISATHQQHKEYLMDLLGRTILTESGLMHAGEVAMQVRAMRMAQKDIDPLYFNLNGNLSWEGNLQGLVQRIDRNLKEGK